MAKAKVTSKGQITIPKEVRERLGLRPGDEVEFLVEKGQVYLKKRLSRSPFDRYVGYLAQKRGQDPDELVRELRGHEG